MAYSKKLDDINIPIALLLVQLVTYPFFIGIRNHTDPIGSVLGALIVIVPLFAILGLLLRGFFKKTRMGDNIVSFMDHRGVKLKEIPGLIGIMVPMSMVMLWMLVYGFLLFLYFFFITIPVYLILRIWKKKHMRNLVKWLFRLEASTCIKLKRFSRLGLIMPYVSGILFSLMTQGYVTLGAFYFLILMQFSFVVAMYNVIGQQAVIVQ